MSHLLIIYIDKIYQNRYHWQRITSSDDIIKKFIRKGRRASSSSIIMLLRVSYKIQNTYNYGVPAIIIIINEMRNSRGLRKQNWKIMRNVEKIVCIRYIV